ncbi:ALS7, partial [Candida africana]
MKKLYLLYLLALFTTVISKEVTGVFNQFNSLIWSYTYRARYEEISTLTAKAQLEWALDGTIASPGDTFTLVMPCVYKFMTYETSVQLTANSIAYATCDFDAGEDTKSFSSLKCTVTDELTEDTSVFGSVILPIAFNVGGSGSKSTITDSKCFSSGYNTVTFFDGNNQLSTTANFLPRRELAFGLVVSQRLSMSLDTMTNFVMSTPCFMGYQLGKLGFTSNDDDFEIDCSSIHVGITNEINDWSMPVSSVPFDHTIRCTSRALYIEFKTIPAGYRPFVDAIVQIPTTEPFFVKYTNEFACVNGIYTSIPFTSFFSQPILYDEALAIGADLVRTTSTVIGSITRTTTLPFISRLQKTKTTLVLEPIPTTTVTTSHHGFDTWYYTKKATIGDTATVFIDVPQHTATTLTTYWQESSTATTTYFDDIDLVDTVIVKIPYPNPTIITTQFWSGKYLTTETHKEPPLGTDSVIIKEPHNPTVTTTEFWSESFATTETVTNGPEGTDSVIIKEPHNPTVTTTEFWSESYATTETITNYPDGTDSVIIREPHNPTVTTTEFWSESFATTETVTNNPEGTDSVIIKEPHNPTVTTTEFWSESFATTETITTGPLGTDSIVIHDPLEELSSSTAIESSDSNISSSAQDSSSLVEQSFTSADETSSIVELSSSSSEESSTSATDALVSSDASSILSSDTSSYYPSSTILPSDDFPHTIAGESDSQSISFITSTVEISSDSVSLTSDPASSFDSSSRLNSDSSSLPSTDQRDILTSSSFSTLIKSSESRESSSGTILSEESSDSIPTTFSTRYVSVSLTVGELSALPSLPGKLSHLPSSLSETSIGMTKSANLLPQFFSTSVDSALLYWALGSSSADHQSSATCDVSESSVEGNLSAMAPGMSNSDDGLSEDTRSSSVAGKEEIELTLTNSVGEITLISYSSSSPTTHDHGRVSKSMGAAPLSSLFSVSVHAPLVTGLLDSDTFPSENSNRSRSFKESTDNTISISRESLGNPYSSISSPSDYDVKLFTTSRELVSSESILPFSDVMDANDMPTSGSNLHSMVFSISVLGEKFNANIEKHKNTNGHYSSMVFTYQSAGLEESDQRIAVTNTKFDQNKIDTTIDSNTFLTSLPFATTSNEQIDQAVPIKIPASSTAGFVSDVLKPDYSKSVQAESVQTDSTTYSEMMSSKRNKNSGFGTSSLNLKPTITVVTKSIDTKVNTMKEGGVSKQVSTTVTEQYDTSTYTPASLLVSDNLGSVSKYSLWMMAFYMLFGLF